MLKGNRPVTLCIDAFVDPNRVEFDRSERTIVDAVVEGRAFVDSVVNIQSDGGSPPSDIVYVKVRTLLCESRRTPWSMIGAKVSGVGATFPTL